MELDISQFAGRSVDIVFEQDQGGIAEHEHIYLESIEIKTTVAVVVPGQRLRGGVTRHSGSRSEPASLKAALASMPDVGEDADFVVPRDMPRELT